MSTTVRRCVSLPICFAVVALLPLLVVALLIVAPIDALLRNRWAATRACLFLAHYAICEAVGVMAAFWLWLTARLSARLDHPAYLRANFRLQCWWAETLYAGIGRIFAVRSDVSGEAALNGGPLVVFARHASAGDTLLPAVLISARHDMVLRYVLKKELLWDPCLDIVGNRLRNYFVDRQAVDPAQEIEQVAQLADELGPREGVLIFPEGTRFSTAKQQKALRELGTHADRDLLERARSLHNVLPPKLGGPIALLQRNLRTDLILLAHTGFEGVERMTDLFNGSLIGRVVKVRFWRIARRDIPTDPVALRTFLFDVWKTVDEWIDDVSTPVKTGERMTTETCRP